MSIEAPQREHPERNKLDDEDSIDDSYVKLVEEKLYPARGDATTEAIRTTEPRPQQLSEVRERLKQHAIEFPSPVKAEQRERPESVAPERPAQQEALAKFVESLYFHRDRRTTANLRTEYAALSPEKALPSVLEQVRIGDRSYRKKVFVGTATGAGLIGMAGLAAGVIDSATGGTFLGQGGELLATYGGVATVAAAIPAAFMIRSGLKMFHSLREQRQQRAAERLLRRQSLTNRAM